MDSFYDKVKAVQTLDRIIAERTTAAASPQMYILDSESIGNYGLSVSRAEGDVASRLTQRNEETGETEEATVGIQGIVCNIKLPPFETRSSRPDDLKRLTHARQSVTLTGLGSSCFDRIVENCRRTYSMFSRYTPNAKLLPAPEFLGKHSTTNDGVSDQHIAITASNRFFTPIKQSTGLEIVNVNAEIDPRGILAKVDRSKFVHTEDNSVDYYVLTECDDQDRQVDLSKSLRRLTLPRYTPTTPIVFQIGDIVEIQVSMTSIPNKGSFTVKMLLRSIILLEGGLTTGLTAQLQEATTARTLITPTAAPVPKRLKRRNPYAGSLHIRKSRGGTHHARIDAETDEELYNEDVTEGQYTEDVDEGQSVELHAENFASMEE